MVMNCLHKDPQIRPASVREVAYTIAPEAMAQPLFITPSHHLADGASLYGGTPQGTVFQGVLHRNGCFGDVIDGCAVHVMDGVTPINFNRPSLLTARPVDLLPPTELFRIT